MPAAASASASARIKEKEAATSESMTARLSRYPNLGRDVPMGSELIGTSVHHGLRPTDAAFVQMNPFASAGGAAFRRLVDSPEHPLKR